jgi:hypothetical protein
VQDYDSKNTVILIDSYLPSEGQMDFQIEALIGYEQGIVTYPCAPGTARVITGESSGWSNIQTISIPADTPLNSSPTPTSSSSYTPNVTATPTSTVNSGSSESFLLITTTAALVVIAALLAVIIFQTSIKEKGVY